MKTHPRCWHCRSPTHGQCFLGPSSPASQDRSSITWLGAPKQRSRSIGLAEQTGKSRTENKHGIVIRRDASIGLNGDGGGPYLRGRHNRGRGCSRSGSGRCSRPLLWLHFDCTGPTHTAVRRSTPHPSYKAARGKTIVWDALSFYVNLVHKQHTPVTLVDALQCSQSGDAARK